jgi:hypothetical protein
VVGEEAEAAVLEVGAVVALAEAAVEVVASVDEVATGAPADVRVASVTGKAVALADEAVEVTGAASNVVRAEETAEVSNAEEVAETGAALSVEVVEVTVVDFNVAKVAAGAVLVTVVAESDNLLSE